MRPRRLIFVATGTAVAMASIAELARDRRPPIRIMIGGFVAAVMLTLLAEASPQLAAGFALLILVAALFTTGDTAWKGITRAIGN